MSASLEKINLLCIGMDCPALKNELMAMKAAAHTEFNMVYKDTLQSASDYLIKECVISRPDTIDAVLLHLKLPNSKGVATFERIKKHCESLPIVIVSDHEDIAYKCIKLGAQDYLLKPEVSAPTLLRSIQYAIERKSNAEALEDSEKKYRDLVELTGAGIYEIDLRTGQFTYVNDVMCKQLGWTREELFNIGPVGILTKKSMDEWLSRWAAYDDGTYSGPIEYEVIRKDGSTLWGLIVAEFTDKVNEVYTKANVVAIDITEQKEKDLALQAKEKAVFNVLGARINEWKKESSIRSVRREQQLDLLTGEILSLENTSPEETR